jgi:spore maturation protein CgeB
MRSFEIPALGSFLLAERTPEHAALFREGEEAEFFSSVEECASKIRIYLADKPRRAAVARAGQRRCLENYSMTEAISRALDQANQIRSCEMKP